ncbi:hypothetical protein, partial [Streptomyces smyrnaeus]|uniref:hypothetical protein n=1 Tax=Streptomyces smyrnaeus TaxID=1387713 RepID=UPI003691CEA0
MEPPWSKAFTSTRICGSLITRSTAEATWGFNRRVAQSATIQAAPPIAGAASRSRALGRGVFRVAGWCR